MTQLSTQDHARSLIDLLHMRQVCADEFAGPITPERHRNGNNRMFGGQVLAQALLAAEATLPAPRQPASFHCRFLRPGSEDHPVTARVSRDMDGANVSHRRVEVAQHGKPILTASVMFHALREPDMSHQPAMPDVPAADALLAELERQVAAGTVPGLVERFLRNKWPLQMVPVDFAQWATTVPEDRPVRVWLRMSTPLGDDLSVHRALLAYASDMTVLRACDVRHGLSWFRGELAQASLDHAIWFHDDFRMDEWLLHTTYSPWSGRGRGLAHGHVFTADGRLVATTTQEGMIHVLKRPGEPELAKEA